ncbi:MAG TPA: PLAT/LH2 domain-containing protein [Fluviicola sp.]|nr:PLAT/LH2 domain-containing protein [Fluviicola sp.]
MDYSHYLVKVKVKDVKSAGTDDPMYIVIFGPNGSTGRLKMNTKADDFATGKTSTFKFEVKNADVTDVGFPYAIGLSKTGGDGVFLEKVDIECYQTDGAMKVAKFPTEIKLGEKGDFDLPKERYFSTSYADGLRRQIKGEFNEKIKDLWVVVDNRGGTFPYQEPAYAVKVSLSSDMIHHDSDSEKTQVKAFYTLESRIVGNGARYELESAFSKEYVFTDAKDYKQNLEAALSIAINCPAGSLLFQRFEIKGSYLFDAVEMGSCLLNIRVKDPKPEVSAVSVEKAEYFFQQDLSAGHKTIYNALFESPFSPTQVGGRVVRNT